MFALVNYLTKEVDSRKIEFDRININKSVVFKKYFWCYLTSDDCFRSNRTPRDDVN